MKILVTGVNGQLGHDLVPELIRRGHEVIGSGSSGPETESAAYRYRCMDITKKEMVDRVMDAVRPDLLIHCAAWTSVDAAEKPENFSRVMAVNAEGTRYLAEACRRCGSAMMYISTDYVFDGQGTEPWRADCKDFAPLNVYGKSKLAGETAVRELLDRYFIVRIAWVFGINGGNFIKTMMKLAETHRELRVVNDQIGTPAYTRDLACLLADMAESDRYGIYHATNEGGFISWYDLAVEIFRQSGQDVLVHPVSTAEYGVSEAVRPFNSRLDKSCLTEQGFSRLPDWKDALARYLLELKNLK